jgi:hypothetical protein
MHLLLLFVAQKTAAEIHMPPQVVDHPCQKMMSNSYSTVSIRV